MCLCEVPCSFLCIALATRVRRDSSCRFLCRETMTHSFLDDGILLIKGPVQNAKGGEDLSSVPLSDVPTLRSRL